jgi:hypothetical protein
MSELQVDTDGRGFLEFSNFTRGPTEAWVTPQHVVNFQVRAIRPLPATASIYYCLTNEQGASLGGITKGPNVTFQTAQAEIAQIKSDRLLDATLLRVWFQWSGWTDTRISLPRLPPLRWPDIKIRPGM